ncbi:MAG: helix-turn-helix domain-containing protein [Phycisphaerae bacterium]|nr:helix-turn-helix domain-containing protein [Phycisphaerae bacterium]
MIADVQISNEPTKPRAWGYKDFADFLGIGVRTAKRWVATGVLPRPDFRRHGVVRWFPETIERWKARQRRDGQKSAAMCS